ncbi:MAG: alkaline phosphatase D family protein [Solirubrobacteraceae bacterium]|nr:alkaline phosphatase D family protein [Solirubrobacteraceae bacterium]
MPDLVLGPLLRYVSDTEATVWVETDAPCTVTVLERSAATFTISGHHYALVVIDGLQPGSTLPYEVALDGEPRWPRPDDPYPPCVVRTHTHDEQLRLAFGSCRVSVPHTEPYVLSKDDDPAGREVDALLALVERMRHQPYEEWPDALLLLGDQVYADEVSPETKKLIRSRRGPDGPPADEVGDFEEYTSLYRESWSDPALRWLLSTVSSAMIFDDHDVHDDWNISEAWVAQMRAKPWWEERVVGAYASYWVYQHLGNLSPTTLFDDPIFCAVQDADGDAEELVRDFARTAVAEIAGARWSFCRDFGRARLVVVDSRAGRVLTEGRRQMLSDAEWAWVEDHCSGDFDHLVIGTSLPVMLAPGMHHLEAWNEAVCDGAWGMLAARAGEKVRQALDLEHWAAFQGCFGRLSVLLEDVAAGRRGPAPATITLLSGDVHHAYLAEAWFPGREISSRVLQVTCSPVRNPLDKRERRALRSAFTRPVAAFARRMARAAGVEPSAMRWAFAQEPTFDNQIARLELCGREAQLCIEKTLPEDWRAPRLHTSLSLGIAPHH